MKPKPLRTRRLVRPADALLPLALFVAATLGRWPLTAELYAGLLVQRMIALSTATSLRAAFAVQPSIRRVRGSVKLALPAQAAGAILALAAYRAFIGAPDPRVLCVAGAALALNIEHVFYEYLYATGDARSASLCRILTAVLTAAGLLMTARAGGDSASPLAGAWLAGATGLAALVAAVMALTIGGRLKGPVNAAILKAAPLAMLHTAAWPALWLLTVAVFRRIGPAMVDGPGGVLGFFAGLTLFELCRTPFRRSGMEARPLNRALLIALAASAAVVAAAIALRVGASSSAWRPDVVPAAAAGVALAAVCAFALFGRISRRDA